MERRLAAILAADVADFPVDCHLPWLQYALRAKRKIVDGPGTQHETFRFYCRCVCAGLSESGQCRPVKLSAPRKNEVSVLQGGRQ